MRVLLVMSSRKEDWSMDEEDVGETGGEENGM